MTAITKQSGIEDGQVACVVADPNTANPPATKLSGTVILKKKKVPAAVPVATEPDEIGELVYHIENLKKEEALARAGLFEDQCHENNFVLGGILSCILRNKWYEPHQSFDVWVDKETAMRRAKARALIAIYDALTSCKVPWVQVRHLGWTKLRTIASFLTPENAAYWVGIASERSKRDLVEFVNEHKAKSATANAETTAAQTKIFKLHSSQAKTVNLAIAKMKNETDTAHDAEALERICKEYLEGQTLPQKLAGLQPPNLAITITQALNALEKDAVAGVLKEVFKTVVYDLEIDPFGLAPMSENLPG